MCDALLRFCGEPSINERQLHFVGKRETKNPEENREKHREKEVNNTSMCLVKFYHCLEGPVSL